MLQADRINKLVWIDKIVGDGADEITMEVGAGTVASRFS